ncbi:MAG: UDP-glucose/GDP-mannose dehydrogenase family protein [Pseudomonadota bacterium]|nr:UDP-glucose/GDP-mannose dehydrogenase family protein [Pseudomonadota bacterium]
MRIAIIGTGYVGLVSGACFSEFGTDVVCVDKDVGKIEHLNAGRIPIFEPGLVPLIEKNVAAGRLSFTTDLDMGVKGADAVLIAVGTPSRRGDGHADLSYVYAAAAEVGRAIDGYTVIVTKSTVPVGTGREVYRILSEIRSSEEFDVASNPEFLREGSAVEDFMRPDRIVIGTSSDTAADLLRRLYRPLYLLETPVIHTQLETAELIKYAANSFLAAKVTFINEIADLCEKVGANVQEVARGIGLDGRIGNKFLHAGPGYGGSCFPKDTLALVQTAKENDSPLKIVEAVVQVNADRKRRMVDKIVGACGGSVHGKTLAVLGLAFKPNTDDIRESPSLEIIPALQAAGAVVRAFDPKGMPEAKKVMSGTVFCVDEYEAMNRADALIIVTEWNEFRLLDLKRVKSLLALPVLVDLRNIYEEDEITRAGLDYYSVGREPVLAGGL